MEAAALLSVRLVSTDAQHDLCKYSLIISVCLKLFGAAMAIATAETR